MSASAASTAQIALFDLGAVASIISGFAVSILWMVLFNFEYYGFVSVIANTMLYEIVPGFIIGGIVAIIVTLIDKAPSKEVEAIFEKATDASIDD